MLLGSKKFGQRSRPVIEVDYNKDLNEAIAEGGYEVVDPAINSDNFPVIAKDGVRRFEVKLVRLCLRANPFIPFRLLTEMKKVKKVIRSALKKRKGPTWQRAGVEHLIAFSAREYRDSKYRNPVIATGTIGRRGVRRDAPFVTKVRGEIYVYLVDRGAFVWSEFYLLLVRPLPEVS